MSAQRKFRIIKEIAEGGFGKVYLAEQTSADGFSRIVAVKLLHAKWSSHDEVVMRTRDEARLLGLIRHQHIVKVEDLTSIDGKCAIVMEYLEGVDLKTMLSFLKDRGEPFPQSALFEIMSAVASALDAAFNSLPLQGTEPLHVIHRDIKPSNIFVTINGGIKLLDFGTSRANFAQREAKTQALAFGSQGYMAPERMLGEEDTPAADIFSLGITLYELLALESFGRIPPRPGKFNTKVAERVASLPLDDSPSSQRIRDMIHRMMSYEPDERPSATDVVNECEVIAEQAAGMSCRRFCRTLVAEAKANEPDVDSGDPLQGKVVEEDASGAFDAGMNVPPPKGDGLDVMSDPPTKPGIMSAKTMPPMSMGEDTKKLTRQRPPADVGPVRVPKSDPNSLPAGGHRGLQKAAVAAAIDSAPPTSSDDSGGSSMVIFGAVAAVGLLALLVVGVAAAFILFSNQGQPQANPRPVPEQPVPVPDPDPDPDPDPAPQVTPEPEVLVSAGSVESEGDWGSASRATTVIKIADAENAEVQVKSSIFGYSAAWNGVGEYELGQIGHGTYNTYVTPPGGKKLRKRFKVDGRRCEFIFSVGDEDWSGGCQ